MKIKALNEVLKKIRKTADEEDLEFKDFLYKLEDLVFQTIAISDYKNKLHLMNHFKYEIEQVFDKKIETLEGMKKGFLAELEDLENKTRKHLNGFKDLKELQQLKVEA